MTRRGDTPSRELLRLVWAVAGAWVAAVVCNALLDNTDDGDPAASVGHELAAIGPLACVALAAVAVGAIGARRSRSASSARAAFALLALGGASQLGAFAWSFVIDVTTPHDGGYDGLVLSGIAAFVVAIGWLALLSRRGEARAADGRAERWGRWAYLAVFGLLSALALITLVVAPDVPNVAAAIVVSVALLGWLAQRARALAGVGEPAPPPATLRPERPGDPATRHYLPAAGEGRIARSWRLTRTAWAVVRRDATMLALAFASLMITAAATAALFWATGWWDHPDHADRVVWLPAAAAWPLTFVGTFFNVALAAAAAAALEGGRLSLRQALGVSLSRIGQVALWSLLAAGVGALLRALSDRVPLGGRVATWIVGAAWGLVTFFAIPILALEGCAALACVTQSTRLIKRRWGEAIGGTVAVTAWAVVVALPAGVVIGVGLALGGAAGVVIIAIGVIALAAVSAFSGAVRQVFAVALYRYATAGHVQGGFREPDLARPFTARWRWR